jgi:outer membrane cobalamin receptor
MNTNFQPSLLRTIETIASCLILSASMLSAQGIQDSMFHISGVEVRAEQLFDKEYAGARETRIDTSLLSEKAILSLSDLLSENTSVFIKEHGRGALATASFRGSAPSHTRVDWNGIPVNSPMAGMVDFSLIPVYLIDQLILQHGPASLASGGGGIGGAIHIGNAVRWNEGMSLKYLQGIGSYRTFDEFLQLGYGKGKLRFKTRVYHNYSKNNFPYINLGIGSLDPVTGQIMHPTETNDHAAYQRYGLLQEVYYRPGLNTLVSLKYWGQSADRSIPAPTSYEGPEQANLNRQQDRDHRVVADLTHYWRLGSWMIRSGFADKQLDYAQENRVPGLGEIPVVLSESEQRSIYNTFSHTFDPDPSFSLEGRLDLNADHVRSRDSVSGMGYEMDRRELAFLISVRKSIVDRINLNLMLRQDWVDGERTPFCPFLGVDLRLIKGKDLLLKGNVARTFHQPSLNDLFWQPGGNPDLLPEVGWSMEAGIEFQTQWSAHLFRTELTAYRTDIENWIVWIPSFKGYWEPGNISRVVSTGLEYTLLLEGRILGIDYRWFGTYAFTRSLNYGDPLVWGDRSYGKQLVYIPLHSGNLLIHLSYRGYFFTYQFNSYSERFTTTSNDLSRRNRLYPYFMNNISAGKEFNFRNMGLVVEFKVNNLFNESYHSVLNRPMPGRNYNLVLLLKI